MNLKKNLQTLIDSLAQGHKQGWYNNGICGEIDDLVTHRSIDTLYARVLREFIEENTPTKEQHPEFHAIYPNHRVFLWWWPRMKDNENARQTRIDFLTKLRDSIQE